MDAADVARCEGNEHFKSGKHAEADKCYATALELLKEFAEGDAVQEATIKCRLNRAACLLKLYGYEAAHYQCSEVIRLDAKNAKGHFRLGQAYEALCMFTEAQAAYTQSIKLNPQLREPRKELEALRARLKANPQLPQKLDDLRLVSCDQSRECG